MIRTRAGNKNVASIRKLDGFNPGATQKSPQNMASHSFKMGKRFMRLIHSPHLLVRTNSERFLLAEGIFKTILANESHWLQLVLVLSVHWWPAPISVGGLLVMLRISRTHLHRLFKVKAFGDEICIVQQHLHVVNVTVNTIRNSWILHLHCHLFALSCDCMVNLRSFNTSKKQRWWS